MHSTLDAVAYGGSGTSPPPLGISAHKEGPLSEASWLGCCGSHRGPIAASALLVPCGGVCGRAPGYLYPYPSLADLGSDRMSISTQLLLRIVNCDFGRFSRFFLQLILNSMTPRTVRLYQAEIPMPVGVCQFVKFRNVTQLHEVLQQYICTTA